MESESSDDTVDEYGYYNYPTSHPIFVGSTLLDPRNCSEGKPEYAPPDYYSYYNDPTSHPIFVGSTVAPRNCSEGKPDQHYRESAAHTGADYNMTISPRATTAKPSSSRSSRPNTAPSAPSNYKARKQYTTHNSLAVRPDHSVSSSSRARHYRKASRSERKGAREHVMQYDAAIRARVSKTVAWATLSWGQRLDLLKETA